MGRRYRQGRSSIRRGVSFRSLHCGRGNQVRVAIESASRSDPEKTLSLTGAKRSRRISSILLPHTNPINNCGSERANTRSEAVR
jgi:hypothetical protein